MFKLKVVSVLSLLLASPSAWADSYRYMHVTIDTPWAIFIFLSVAVLAPFILMAVLYWRQAFRRNAEDDAKEEAENKESEKHS